MDQVLRVRKSLRIAVVSSEYPEIGIRSGAILAAVQHEHLTVIERIHRPGQNELFLVVHALDAAGFVFGLRKRRQEQRCEQSDDRDDDEKLDECEGWNGSLPRSSSQAAGRCWPAESAHNAPMVPGFSSLGKNTFRTSRPPPSANS